MRRRTSQTGGSGIGKDQEKRGYMNVFFAGAVIVVLLLSLTLTREAGLMRIRMKEMQMMLEFDYRVEAYYLLLHSGALSLTEEEAYGSFEEYELTKEKNHERFIRIHKEGERTIIRGSLWGKERGYYEITK